MCCLTRLPEAASAAISRLAVPYVPFWPIARLSITVHAAPVAMRTSSKQLVSCLSRHVLG